jgi:hypothetical protein
LLFLPANIPSFHYSNIQTIRKDEQVSFHPSAFILFLRTYIAAPDEASRPSALSRPDPRLIFQESGFSPFPPRRRLTGS